MDCVEHLKVGDMVSCFMDAGEVKVQGDSIPLTFKHRGIYVGYTHQCGQHSVVHNFCGTDEDGSGGSKKQMKMGGGDGGVIIWSMDDFKENANNNYWWVSNCWPRFGPTPYTGEEIARRALNRFGERKYDVGANNCEHFAFWCRYNKAESPQVEKLVGNLVIGTLGALSECSIL